MDACNNFGIEKEELLEFEHSRQYMQYFNLMAETFEKMHMVLDKDTSSRVFWERIQTTYNKDSHSHHCKAE